MISDNLIVCLKIWKRTIWSDLLSKNGLFDCDWVGIFCSGVTNFTLKTQSRELTKLNTFSGFFLSPKKESSWAKILNSISENFKFRKHNPPWSDPPKKVWKSFHHFVQACDCVSVCNTWPPLILSTKSQRNAWPKNWPFLLRKGISH